MWRNAWTLATLQLPNQMDHYATYAWCILSFASHWLNDNLKVTSPNERHVILPGVFGKHIWCMLCKCQMLRPHSNGRHPLTSGFVNATTRTYRLPFLFLFLFFTFFLIFLFFIFCTFGRFDLIFPNIMFSNPKKYHLLKIKKKLYIFISNYK